MAVITTQTRVAVSIKLDFGATDTGTRIIKSVSLGSLKKNAFDAQKAYNVVNLLAPCLAYNIVEVQQTTTNLLAEGE